MSDPVRAIAYIGLGSNLENPLVQIKSARLELSGMPGVSSAKHSSLYATKPVGPQGQPDYINAVAELETGLQPDQLLLELQKLMPREIAQVSVDLNQPEESCIVVTAKRPSRKRPRVSTPKPGRSGHLRRLNLTPPKPSRLTSAKLN